MFHVSPALPGNDAVCHVSPALPGNDAVRHVSPAELGWVHGGYPGGHAGRVVHRLQPTPKVNRNRVIEVFEWLMCAVPKDPIQCNIYRTVPFSYRYISLCGFYFTVILFLSYRFVALFE